MSTVRSVCAKWFYNPTHVQNMPFMMRSICTFFCHIPYKMRSCMNMQQLMAMLCAIFFFYFHGPLLWSFTHFYINSLQQSVYLTQKHYNNMAIHKYISLGKYNPLFTYFDKYLHICGWVYRKPSLYQIFIYQIFNTLNIFKTPHTFHTYDHVYQIMLQESRQVGAYQEFMP